MTLQTIPILVTGSIAYDYIMRFPDIFSRHILPDKLQMLNVCFTTNEMSKNYGGTAGNIAYSMALLKSPPIVFGSVGKDFADYAKWMQKNQIDVSYIQICEEEWTASAHIITDKEENQITGFYGGAMFRNEISILPLLRKQKIALAIVSPDGRNGMLLHARELQQEKVPYIFDPGQSIPSFNEQEILAMADGSFMTILNEYELHLVLQKTGMSMQDLLGKTKYVIVTKGQDGSVVFTKEGETAIPIAPVAKAIDPTGAGDAYRAGLLKALYHQVPVVVAAKFASIAASYSVEKPGTQNHSYSIVEFQERLRKVFPNDRDFEKILFS